MRTLALAAFIAATVIGSQGSVRADEYAPSDLSAVAILAKAHEAEGRLAPGSYLILSHAHGGGVDDTLTTHVNGDDYLTIDQTGDYITSYGSYKGQSWSRDENGVVLLNSDFVAHVDPNVLALAHPEDPKYRVMVRGITRSTPHEYVVEVNPPGGSDQYRYYDASTMLLARVVTFEKDRHKHVWTYEDYHAAFGETRAYHTHYSDGRSDNETDTWTTSVARESDPVPLAIPSPAAIYTFPTSAPVQLPAEFTDYGIIVRASIGNRGLDFVLDSGASDVTLDPDIAHQLGIAPYGKYTNTDGGEVDESRARIAQLRVGPLSLENVKVSLVPIAINTGDARVVGLLGCDFIAGGVVGIDFHDKIVTLYPRATFDPAKVGVIASRPIDVDDGIPRVQGSIEQVPGAFLIDTGSFTTVLYPNYLRKLHGALLSDKSTPAMVTVGGTLPTVPYVVSDLELGPSTFNSVDVSVPATSTWDILDYDGVVGRDLLSHYTIYLDYVNRLVYFKPEK